MTGAAADPEEPAPAVRRRMPAGDRRRQLIGIGLELLTERPVTEITVEEVSRRAGISRSLLFNYFPTRRDYHLAVIRAAMNRMWRIAAPAGEAAGDVRIATVIERFVAFLERRRDPYVAIARGIAGTDPAVAQIRLESRDRLVGVLATALGRERGPELDLLLAGWLALAEEMVLTWVDRRVITREQLTATLERSLRTLAADGIADA